MLVRLGKVRDVHDILRVIRQYREMYPIKQLGQVNKSLDSLIWISSSDKKKKKDCLELVTSLNQKANQSL